MEVRVRFTAVALIEFFLFDDSLTSNVIKSNVWFPMPSSTDILPLENDIS